MFWYWKELWRLFRERKDNPLVHYGAPWRRGKSYIVVSTLMMFVWLAAIGVLLHESLAFQPLCFIRGSFSFSAYQGLLFSTILGIMCWVPFVFRVFAFDLRATDLIQQFGLTRMKRGEIAFGCLYWAGLISLLTSFSVLLALSSIPIGEYINFTGWGRWRPREGFFSNFWYFTEDWRLATFTFSIVLISMIGIIVCTVRRWLRSSSGAVLNILLASVPSLTSVILLMMAIDAEIPYFNADDLAEDPWIALRCLALALAGVAVSVPACCMGAGASLFRHADPEQFLINDWAGREKQTRRVSKALKVGRGHLAAFCKRRWIVDLLYCVIAIQVSLLFLLFICGHNYSTLINYHGYSPVIMALLTTLVVVMRRASGRLHTFVMPVISGELLRSALAWLVVPCIGYLIGSSMLMWEIYNCETDRSVFRLVFRGILLPFVSAFTTMLILIPRKGRLKCFVILSLCALGVVAASYIGNAMDLPRYGYDGRIDDSATFRPFLLSIAFVLCLLPVCALPLGLFSILMQRIHNLEVRNQIAGRLSTDPIPDNVGEIIPYELPSTQSSASSST